MCNVVITICNYYFFCLLASLMTNINKIAEHIVKLSYKMTYIEAILECIKIYDEDAVIEAVKEHKFIYASFENECMKKRLLKKNDSRIVPLF
jgi:hypothetical protein